MPPEKDKKLSINSLNTSAQIQQIFSEVQSQLPSLNFDSDDQNEEDNIELNTIDNTNTFLQSSSNTNSNSLLTLHPKVEISEQQISNVELQMSSSPNFVKYSQVEESSFRPPILSTDLFNSIDFDKLTCFTNNYNITQDPNLTLTNHRSQLTTTSPYSSLSSNTIPRDDHQILECLTQQANRFNNNTTNKRTQRTTRHGSFKNLESSQQKTVYIDLRHFETEKKDKIQCEQKSINIINRILQRNQSNEQSSESDNDIDEILWFEQRKQAKQQQLFMSNK